MNQENFINQKRDWLEDVCAHCNEFGQRNQESVNLSYYVFQTPCKNYQPELLIIGINPGGNDAFKKRVSSELEGYDENILVSKPVWEKGKGTDVIRQNFQRVFNNELEFLIKNSVMMNMIYFNTPTEKALNQLPKDVREYCVAKTIEFIEILNPKKILFLTSTEDKLKRYGVAKIESLGSQVKKGSLRGREIFAIPHYAYLDTWKGEKGRQMSTKLKGIFIGDPVMI